MAEMTNNLNLETFIDSEVSLLLESGPATVALLDSVVTVSARRVESDMTAILGFEVNGVLVFTADGYTRGTYLSVAIDDLIDSRALHNYDPMSGLSSDFSACHGGSTPMIMDGPASWYDCFGTILTSDFPDFANIPARVATIARAESARGFQS